MSLLQCRLRGKLGQVHADLAPPATEIESGQQTQKQTEVKITPAHRATGCRLGSPCNSVTWSMFPPEPPQIDPNRKGPDVATGTSRHLRGRRRAVAIGSDREEEWRGSDPAARTGSAPWRLQPPLLNAIERIPAMEADLCGAGSEEWRGGERSTDLR